MPAKKQIRHIENGQIITIYPKTVAKEFLDDKANPAFGDSEEKVYIRFEKPQSKSLPDGPIKPHHKRNFPEAWAKYENQDFSTPGTLLAVLEMPENVVEDYSRRGVTTVEDFVKLDPESLKGFPMGREYQKQAKAYLDVNNPEVQARKEQELADKIKKELFAEITQNPEVLKELAAEAGLETRKKRASKEAV